MSIANKYIIDYQSMKNGHYALDFKVDGDLFREFESADVKGAECDVHVEMERTQSAIQLSVAITGNAIVECDRCLDDCSIPVDFEGDLTVHLSDQEGEYDGEQMWIAPGADLSLAQYIYESVIVSLPYSRVHEDGECDPDMLARFIVAKEEDIE